ncbi:ferrous iron transport domain-containing protein [Rhizoctonia solani AG-1 IA]|uniref:Ferrous iron transport domain-containing protein n=1 Tax=Thanatephorus cucumeris (strain AG1-IA) TaxID=983506 RepID=L8X2C1_THACA|nr:ferrous iron transport domain-containing protein [Rhizoctonia solani AG-1 IA]
MGVLEKVRLTRGRSTRSADRDYWAFYVTDISPQATEYHLGLLKAKLARYRAQLLEPTSKGGKPGEDARVALIGFPSVGKSTLLSLTTKTASEAASYEFTTLTAIPGVLEYEGVRIQLLDLPGIVEGASQGLPIRT